jgi:hypothetical protein
MPCTPTPIPAHPPQRWLGSVPDAARTCLIARLRSSSATACPTLQSKSAGVIKALAQARQELERGEDQAGFINPLALAAGAADPVTFRMPGGREARAGMPKWRLVKAVAAFTSALSSDGVLFIETSYINQQARASRLVPPLDASLRCAPA